MIWLAVILITAPPNFGVTMEIPTQSEKACEFHLAKLEELTGQLRPDAYFRGRCIQQREA